MTMLLLSVHGFDPRGPKVGGIETHVRQLLRCHPADMRAMIVGIDDFGDAEIGKVQQITVAGREIDFLPVLHVSSANQTGAATSVGESITFRFAMALLRYLPRIREAIRGRTVSAEIERFEYAPIIRMLGCPFVLVTHNEGDPRTDKMDSILSKYWYVNSIAEWMAVRLADRIYGVTPRIRDRIVARYPRVADKVNVLTVSVDTGIFRATPFDLEDGKLRLVYAGRLDEFKDPRLMFRVVRRLHEVLDGAFEFHYCGSADPYRFEEFRAIETFSVCHGSLTPDGVAAVMRRCHIGILVSHWEGMPCFLLELLASGRAFGGLRLPQFDQVVENGLNGRMVERAPTAELSEDGVAAAIIEQWREIRDGRVDPDKIHARIIPWSVDVQLNRLFTSLRDIRLPSDNPKAHGGTGGHASAAS